MESSKTSDVRSASQRVGKNTPKTEETTQTDQTLPATENDVEECD